MTVTETQDRTLVPSTPSESFAVWITISTDSGEAEPVTEILTTTKFVTVHSTLLSKTTVTKTVKATETSVTPATATSKERSVVTTIALFTTTVTEPDLPV